MKLAVVVCCIALVERVARDAAHKSDSGGGAQPRLRGPLTASKGMCVRCHNELIQDWLCIAARNLRPLNGFEESFDVSATKSLRTCALDDLEEKRGPVLQGLTEYLK